MIILPFILPCWSQSNRQNRGGFSGWAQATEDLHAALDARQQALSASDAPDALAAAAAAETEVQPC